MDERGRWAEGSSRVPTAVHTAALTRSFKYACRALTLAKYQAALKSAGDGHVVVWVAVFGYEPRKTQTLGIDMRPFGRDIGLVVDNFTIPAESGSETFEIKPHGA
jgi:hypothetical protein